MAAESVASEPNVRTLGIPCLAEIRGLKDFNGGSDPFLVAAAIAVRDAWELPGDWPVFLFVGSEGALQLIDFGAEGEGDSTIPGGFQVACAIPRVPCGRRLGKCDECGCTLGTVSRRTAERLLAHFVTRGLPS